MNNSVTTLVNKYMDAYQKTKELSDKAKAEKYAKITAKTIIYSGEGDASSYGQNAFFYDAAEGLLTSVILLVPIFLFEKTSARFLVSPRLQRLQRLRLRLIQTLMYPITMV